jgi:hypothetical protein
MSQEYALQRLMQYAVAHMVRGLPSSQDSHRALMALSGQFGGNPPFVIDAFDLGISSRAYIWAVAISPSGQLAIVVGEPQDQVGVSKLLLTTWPRPRGYSELKELGIVKDDAQVNVFFPERSKEPAVIHSGRELIWGSWTVPLPWGDDLEVPVEACLTLWENDDHFQQVAFLEDGEIHYEMNVVGGCTKPHAKNVRWIGYRWESLLAIQVNKRGKDVLLCRGKEVVMDDGDKIEVDSITADQHRIKFVVSCEDGHGFKVVDVAVEETAKSQSADICIWGDGCVLAFDPEHCVFSELDFSGRWRKLGESGQTKSWVKSAKRLFDMGDHRIIVEKDQTSDLDRLVIIQEDGQIGTVVVARGPKTGFVRAHQGLLYQTTVTGADGFVWSNMGYEPNKRPDSRMFPLYNRFDTLTPVHDDRGRAIMSWGYTEGTFCVIRYPLPTR